VTAWSIILHGGASKVTAKRQPAVLHGCRVALEDGLRAFARQADPVEAAVAAVAALERNGVFNAGQGAVTNIEDRCETDAAVMDGTTLNIGAVAAVPEHRSPVSLAHALLREETVLLAGAAAAGLLPAPPIAEVPGHDRAARRGCDTVGCVVWRDGQVAVATSTGGLHGKPAGRIGDSPLPGCGFYADNRYGGVAVSGDGERITRVLLAARVMEMLRAERGPHAAANAGLAALADVGGEAGVIVLDTRGRCGCAHNSLHFPVAFANSEGTRWAALSGNATPGRAESR
jgi:L-asparaginase / beta-aspartyl-peptidase